MTKSQKLKYFLLLLACYLFFSTGALAAEFLLIPPASTIYIGDVFAVEIQVSSAEVAVNALRVDINFPPDLLELITIEKVGSILRFFPQEPSLSNTFGLASIVGGLPDPGFQGSNGVVGMVLFRARETGMAEVRFGETSRAVLNDGLGSEAQLVIPGLKLAIRTPPAGYVPTAPKIPSDTWPPNTFSPLISQSDDALAGKYFVAFETQDHESGIDHYEVKEIADGVSGEWRVAVSPHVLEHQEGRLEVLVKAIDRAGNETIGSVEAVLGKKKLLITLTVMLSLIFVGSAVWFLRRSALMKRSSVKRCKTEDEVTPT